MQVQASLTWLLCAALPLLAEAKKKAKQGMQNAQSSFNLNGDRWDIMYGQERKAPYYYNSATGHSQWADPRLGDGTEDTFITFLIFMLPFVLMTVAGAGYLLYVRVAHPDVFQKPKKGQKPVKHSLAKIGAENRKKLAYSKSGGDLAGDAASAEASAAADEPKKEK